jgi:hypothetical protein
VIASQPVLPPRLGREYADQGLVAIGVHTPEFAFERNLGNVRRAVQEMKIDYRSRSTTTTRSGAPLVLTEISGRAPQVGFGNFRPRRDHVPWTNQGLPLARLAARSATVGTSAARDRGACPMVKQLRILWKHLSRAPAADPGRFAGGSAVDDGRR